MNLEICSIEEEKRQNLPGSSDIIRSNHPKTETIIPHSPRQIPLMYIATPVERHDHLLHGGVRFKIKSGVVTQ